MDSEFNSNSFEEEFQENEIVIGESERFVYSKKRIYGRMHFLKRPSAKYKDDLVAIESLRKEFAIGYSLDHPNIAKYFRLENDTLIEEYIDGKSLRTLMEGGDPRIRSRHFLQKLCVQLLDVLRYLREAGVVHNDIKPENIVVTRIGDSLKLIDFNCAQSSDNDILGGHTVPYKAPEQGRGAVHSTSDLYQVGKVMEELSTRAGYYKSWKRFIEGASAGSPGDRVSLETAEKLIPRQNKFKKLYPVILLLLILAVASIILMPRRHAEPIKITPRIPVRDTVAVIEAPEPPAEEVLPAKREPAAVDVKKVIEKKILDYTDAYYKTHLYPVCREAMETPGRRLTAEEESTLQKAIDEAYRAAVDYGVKLSGEYPEERSYIEQECLHSFEMKISSMLLRLYPPAAEYADEPGE